MLSYTAGTYLKEVGNDRGLQAVGTSGGNVTFSESPREKGKYNIRLTAYLHANTNNSTYYSDHCSSNGCAAHDHILEEVTALPVTIGSIGYSTLYTPVALQIPDGVAAYTAEVEEEYVALTSLDDVIPANNAVILEAATDEYEFTITDDVEFSGNNAFLGTFEKMAASNVTNPYTLQTSSSAGVVMRQYTGEYLNAFKMYMDISESSGIQSLSFRFPDSGTTSIGYIETESKKATEIYDLQGRRIAKPSKGIYIINNKKVIF